MSISLTHHLSALFSLFSAKPLTPSKPKFVNHTVSSITVTWSKNDIEIYPITAFIIKYRIRGTSKWKEQFVKLPQKHFTYGGLRPFTFCEFQVIAVNDAGHSRPGAIDYFVSKEASKYIWYISSRELNNVLKF